MQAFHQKSSENQKLSTTTITQFRKVKHFIKNLKNQVKNQKLSTTTITRFRKVKHFIKNQMKNLKLIDKNKNSVQKMLPFHQKRKIHKIKKKNSSENSSI